MKKWYEVYAECWNKEEREWQLMKFNILKFIIMRIYFKFHICELDVEDFKYVSPKRVLL